MNIRQWRPDSGRQPVIRIGVVLAADELPTLEMCCPAQPYDLRSADEAVPAHALTSAAVTAHLQGGRVGVSIDGRAPQFADRWFIDPRSAVPLVRGAGWMVRGVVAGRGFHWRKRLDQTLPGRIELRAADRGLILINELPLEDYLAGVITAEMSGECPADLLRAQCVVARSWLLAFTETMHAADPFDRCNDDCCQRYQGTGGLSDTAIAAVQATRGEVLIAPDGVVVDANYSKSCGGVSELPEHIWGVRKSGLASILDAPPESPARRFLPVTEAQLDEYLDGSWLAGADIYCSPNAVSKELFGRYLGRVDETDDYFRWTARYSRPELEDLLRRKLTAAADLAVLHDLRVTRRGVSGRAIEIEIDFDDTAGRRRTTPVPDQYQIRRILHPSFLYSSAFVVRIARNGRGLPETITLRGAGWGHGAGLCQIGALGMALQEIPYARIVTHYFPQAALRRVYT